MYEGTIHFGQDRLIGDRSHRFHIVVGGVGYGKTHVGPVWCYPRIVDNYRSRKSLVVAPDNSLLEQECFEAIDQFFTAGGLREGPNGHYQINRQKMFIDVRLDGKHRSIRHRIIGKTGEKPGKIVAHTTAFAWIDETALCVEQVLKNVIKRNRCPLAFYRQILMTTTPEGDNWFQERFGDNKVPRVEGTVFSESATTLILHGSSLDNPYLDDAYRQTLWDEFGHDPLYYANYVLGQWVSLARDRFYFAYEPAHEGDYPADHRNQQLILTFDRNVHQMTWVAMQPFANTYRVVKDNAGSAPTIDHACEQFIAAFPPTIWGRHHLTIFGDATLWHRSDQTYLRGFDVIRDNLKKYYPNLRIAAPDGNPFIEERKRNTNRLLGNNRLLIDRGCKTVIRSAKLTQSDRKTGVKKPPGDDVTHAMEAIDMALMVLDPPLIKRSFAGFK